MNRPLRRSSIFAAIEVAVLSTGLLVIAAPPLVADEEDCARAASHYNATLNDVSVALQHFSNCTATSGGRDNCSREFDRVKSTGDDFKDAVSSYRSDCK